MKTIAYYKKKLKLDYVDRDIIEANFPYVKPEKNQYKLVRFNGARESDQVLKSLSENGLRPATLWEMLEWAIQDWNGEMVIALGSVWEFPRGSFGTIYLIRGNAKNVLRLGAYDFVWFEGCRFLAVRTSNKSLEKLKR